MPTEIELLLTFTVKNDPHAALLTCCTQRVTIQHYTRRQKVVRAFSALR